MKILREKKIASDYLGMLGPGVHPKSGSDLLEIPDLNPSFKKS